MVGRTLAVAAVMLALWCVLCQVALGLHWRPSTFATPRTENLATAERLATRSRPPGVLMAGSSLTHRFAVGGTDDEPFFALGLSGHSAVTGLRLLLGILRRDPSQKPGLVVVEIDVLAGAHDDLSPYLTSAPMFYVRRYVAGLRYEYQPLNCLLSLLNSGRRASESAQGFAPEDTKAVNGARAKVAEMRETQRSTEAAVAALAPLVRRVEAYGIPVVFVRIPTSPVILDSPQQKTLLAAVRARFPKNQLILFDENIPIRLEDGFHLTRRSACAVRTRLMAILHRRYPGRVSLQPLPCAAFD